MPFSITSQLTMYEALLEIWTSVPRKIIVWVLPMWFLETFESMPEILRDPTMQYQPLPGELVTSISCC